MKRYFLLCSVLFIQICTNLDLVYSSRADLYLTPRPAKRSGDFRGNRRSSSPVVCSPKSECETLVRNEFITGSCRTNNQRTKCSCVMNLLGLEFCANPSDPTIAQLYKASRTEPLDLQNITALAAQLKITDPSTIASLANNIGSLGPQILEAASTSPGVVNDFFYPVNSQFGPRPDVFMTITVYVANKDETFLYDVLANGKPNYKPYTKYTEGCYNYLHGNTSESCTIYGVNSAPFEITILDLFFAGASSIFGTLNFVFLFLFFCCFDHCCSFSCCISQKKATKIRGWVCSFLCMEFFFLLIALAATWGKFYPSRYLCETNMCMRTVHNAVLTLSGLVFEILRLCIEWEIITAVTKQDSDVTTCCSRFYGVVVWLLASLGYAASNALNMAWLVKDVSALYAQSPGLGTVTIGVIAAILAGLVAVFSCAVRLWPKAVDKTVRSVCWRCGCAPQAAVEEGKVEEGGGKGKSAATADIVLPT